jgi:hypothetical protein
MKNGTCGTLTEVFAQFNRTSPLQSTVKPVPVSPPRQ